MCRSPEIGLLPRRHLPLNANLWVFGDSLPKRVNTCPRPSLNVVFRHLAILVS